MGEGCRYDDWPNVGREPTCFRRRCSTCPYRYNCKNYHAGPYDDFGLGRNITWQSMSSTDRIKTFVSKLR